MSPIAPALSALAAEIATLTEGLGRRVEVQDLRVTDRASDLTLAPPGLSSPNQACRLVEAADGWIAVNLARDEDRDLVAAWLGGAFGEEPWLQIGRLARGRSKDQLVEQAALLGLPVAAVGEIASDRLEAPLLRMAARCASPRHGPLRVIDLSTLWAGPLCGAVLAEMGAAVTKVEDLGRPDPTRTATPDFHRRLNGRKSDLGLDFSNPAQRAALRDLVLGADVLITSARPRAFAPLGLAPASIFAANPGLVWVAITGYGWTSGDPARVAFGDDAAAAGGLLGWTSDGAPRFLGDALADPVTGLAAAIGALRGLMENGGVVVDAALARCAAGAAMMRRQGCPA
ncbi:MAG TPA: CoA transferase [Caulobacteraceae bacterium]